MATTDVLRRKIDRLEASAVEIESEARKMFNGANLGSRDQDPDEPNFGPTYFWVKPKDDAWLELQRSVTRKYLKWYSAASYLLKEYLPDSEKDFISLYKHSGDYNNSGFFFALWLNIGEYDGNVDVVVDRYMNLFEMQRSLLLSIPDRVEVKELDLRRIISADLVESELEYADYIYRNQNKGPCERAACVLAGVALERHLKTWCEVCLVPLPTDKKPTLNTLIDALYSGGKGHIDLTEKNKLETMATIRNNCAHPDNVERSRIRELIQDVKRVLTWPMD